jgi:argininosuccinate lyase
MGSTLPRWVEDLVIYSKGEFGFVRLADSQPSDGNLMPQRKNPNGQ